MSERDLLVSRIVDRVAAPVDWARFDELSRADGTAAEDLIAALRDDTMLRCAVGSAFAVADAVPLPAQRCRLLRAGRPWAGWLAAALVVLGWMIGESWRAAEVDAPPPVPAAAAPTPAPDGEVVGELPHVLVETRSIPDSDRVEVVFLRRTVERAVVTGAFAVSHDESGTPFEARVDLTGFTANRNY